MLDTELIPAQDGSLSHLMIALHGLGDSMEGYRWLPQEMRIPWLNYLLVNAPTPYYGGFSWYDFASTSAGADIEVSRKLLFDLLDDQRARGFATERTVLFGFSQGCLMTIEAGLRYPHEFGGLVGVSGYAFEPEQAIRKLPPTAVRQRFLLTHGTLDGLIPIGPVRSQISLLKSAGITIDWREFQKDHTIAGDEELAVIREFVQAGKSSPVRSQTRS